MTRSIWAVAALLSLAGAADAAPTNTLRDMFAQLRECLATVPVAAGTDVTLQFMVNRRGVLIGKPRLTHALWPKDADPREAAAAIASGFDRCMPLSITDALGGAVAGRLMDFRIRAETQERKA